MARVTTFTITERRALAQYEHREVTLSGIIDEKDSETEAIARAVRIASDNVLRPEREASEQQRAIDKAKRDATYATYKEALGRFDPAKASPEQVSAWGKYVEWVADYESREIKS